MPIWPMWPKFEVNGLDWQCFLAGSSKRAPRILIFSIAMGAKCLSYLKSIETHARAFLTHIILSIGTVLHSYTSKKKIIFKILPFPEVADIDYITQY